MRLTGERMILKVLEVRTWEGGQVFLTSRASVKMTGICLFGWWLGRLLLIPSRHCLSRLTVTKTLFAVVFNVIRHPIKRMVSSCIRLTGVTGYDERTNDIIFVPSSEKRNAETQAQTDGSDVVVFFGGDVQVRLYVQWYNELNLTILNFVACLNDFVACLRLHQMVTIK